MRRFPLFLAALLLATPMWAQEGDEDVETFVDKRSGLRVAMPLGWSREEDREEGSVRFAGVYDLSRSRYVLFTVETGSAMGFDEAQWLENEKAAAGKFLKSFDTPWSTEAVTIGGERATRYTVGGKANADAEYDLRVRGSGVVYGETFFRIVELSFNKVHEDEGVPEAVTAMWKAISFQEPDPFAVEGGEEAGEEEGAETDAPAGEPIVIEDASGNFKVSVPPGWSLERAPPEDEEMDLRIMMIRKSTDGEDLAAFEIFRIRWRNSETFVIEEPADFVQNQLTQDIRFFEPFYEEGSSRVIRPRVDVREKLGGVDKSCSYECRGIRMSEDAKIREAQALVDRGDKTAKVPEFKDLVIRGRLAMLSPHIYITRCVFRRDVSDNEKLLEEFNAIHDSWEFGSTQARPPQLQGKDGPFGDTRENPDNKEERKLDKLLEAKAGAKVVAKLKVDYVLPEGFQEAEMVQGRVTSEEWPLQIVAQDANNGWVWIRMYAKHARVLPPNTEFENKKQVFETWISNFESRARGTGRMPKKPEKVRIGNLSGDGCELEGTIDKFHATEVDLVTDTSGWRIIIEIETRGTGAETFEDGLKRFRRRFRASKR